MGGNGGISISRGAKAKLTISPVHMGRGGEKTTPSGGKKTAGTAP